MPDLRSDRRLWQRPALLLPLLPLFLAACGHGSATPITDADAAARAAVANERALVATATDPRTVGVVPLAAADSALEPLAFAIADFLLTDLSRSRQLTVVDRTELHAILRELDLAGSGRVDSATAPRTGHLLRAGRLVVGAIGPAAREAVRLDARTADVNSGRVVVAGTADATLSQVLDAEKTIALRIFDALGVTLTPAERVAVEARPTRNLAALLAYGRAVRYEVEGAYASAAAEYSRASLLDPNFRLARRRLSDLQAHADMWPLPVVPAFEHSPGFTVGVGTLGAVMIDNVNRTFPVGTRGDSRSPADPAFPITQATVILTVVLP